MVRSRNEKIIKAFGKKLKEIRSGKKLSLRELAAMTGIDHKNIDEMEKGERNCMISTLATLAEALEVEPFELLQK